MGKAILVCHSNMRNDGLVIGKEYEARVDSLNNVFTINDDSIGLCDFTMFVDEFGESYKDWFTVKYTYMSEQGREATITTVEQAKNVIVATAMVRMHTYDTLNEDKELLEIANVFGIDLSSIKVTDSSSHWDYAYQYEFIEKKEISKEDVLSWLNIEMEKAKGRQTPNATKDSGCMRGLRKAIDLIEERYI